MGKKTGIFAEGDKVFAKVKGYSPWPAKITRVIAKHRYGVYFYGTGETASVRSEDLDPYDSRNCSRFNTDRQMKKNDYSEAVAQIEAAISGNDPPPIITADYSNAANNNSTQDNFDISQDDIDDDSQLHIDESEVPQSTPQAPPKKKAPVAKTKNDQFSTPEPAEQKENDDKVSRSGRRIKEKKMSLDEIDIDEVFSQQTRKRAKLEDVRINKSVLSPADSTSNAIEEFRLNKLEVLTDPLKKKILLTQYDIIHHVQDIKMNLSLEQANVEQSINLLEHIKANILPNITKLMLLKYPNTVDTIKRLRNYIGNISSWTMEDTQLEEFKEKSQTVRTLANEIYDEFKKLFEVPEGTSFLQTFADQELEFQAKTRNVNSADLFEASTIEELEAFIEKSNQNDDAQVPEVPLSLEDEPSQNDGNNMTVTTEGDEPMKPEP